MAIIRRSLLGASIVLSLCFCLIYDELFSVITEAVVGAMSIALVADYVLTKREHSINFVQSALITAWILSGAIYITGLTASPFVPLYLPAVMLFAVSTSKSETLTFAALSGVSYGVLVALVNLEVLPMVSGVYGKVFAPGGLVAHFVGLYSGLFLVAMGTRFLVHHAQAGFAKAEESSKALKELNTERHKLAARLQDVEDQLELQERMARLLKGEHITEGGIQTRLKEFIGESVVMQKVFELISRVAPTDATTLISGESGTGKELVARAIHLGSKRSNKKFIVVNCGAIPDALLESELFGHKKGAFTGAIADHIGLFQEADGGTLFLDEIGELPLAMQAKLLRALQERTVRPVGASKDIEIDVRILAATNRNLKQEVLGGKFREDLYYRLNVISVHIPALRERKEDIPFLVNSLLKAIVGDQTMPMIPPTTMKLLAEYNYPGNVRELENILERAYVMGGDAILPEHLPDTMWDQKTPPQSTTPRRETMIVETPSNIEFPVNLDEILASIEQKYLELALEQSKGAKKKAAELLGINFRSFRYRLSKFSMHEDEMHD